MFCTLYLLSILFDTRIGSGSSSAYIGFGSSDAAGARIGNGSSTDASTRIGYGFIKYHWYFLYSSFASCLVLVLTLVLLPVVGLVLMSGR